MLHDTIAPDGAGVKGEAAMRVGVIGGGAVGLGSAALLRQMGHQPMLWSPGLSAQPGPAVLHSEGAITGMFDVHVADTAEAAADDASAVLVCLPAWAHRAAFDALAPVLGAGQAVIISSHASLGGLYLRRIVKPGVTVAAWGTTAVTGRRTGPLSCALSNVRTRADIAAIPATDGAAALHLCQALFGDRFTPRAGLLAIQLSNVNPQNHLAMLLCNLTRAERGEAWGNYWGITPAVARLMEALDAERLALAAACGVEVRTLHEHFHWSFGVPMGPMAEMAAAVDARSPGVRGPASLDTRYISEDLPYGIAVTEALAGIAGVPAPLHSAGVWMFNALCGQDFRAANTLLPAMGLDGTDLAALRAAMA